MAPPARSTAKAPARGGTGTRAAAAGRGAREGAARARAPTEVEAPGGAAVKVGGDPENDPRFRKVIEQLEKGADKTKRHPPASAKAAEAQAAAVPPANARQAGAKANQVDAMKEAEAPKAEPDSFLAMLREEIEKVMPRNLDEADKFMEGGETQQVKGAVSGGVSQQQEAVAGPTQQAAAASPDPSGVPQKEVAPLPGETAPAPPAIDAAAAMPAPKPEAQVAALGQAKQDAGQQLQDAELTPQQLQKANDPRFSAVLTAKAKVEKVATAAPGRFRANEKSALTESATKARGDTKTGLTSMVGVRTGANAQVTARQQAAKERDEKRRKEVADNVERIYSRTKQKVEAKLATLEPDVMRMFDAGADAALSDMKDYANREIDRFKDERYSGVTGAAQWVADLFRPVPEGIKTILRQARARFASKMDALAVRIASTVDQRLKEAKDEITKGQAEVKTYVDGLPRDLQAVGRQAEQAVASRFEELRNGIEEKKRGLAQQLAQKYKEAHDKADAAIKKLEEENEGALKGLADAVGEVIKILTEFKDKLMALLRKGADTIDLILKDPIGFLSNLLAALKQGFNQFVGNIWAHLKRGFMQWLFGALAEAGIQIPSDLNLWSILKLVLDVLGLTYAWMRSEAVKLVGERNVALIEKLVDYISVTIRGGPQALWEKLKEDLSNLKAMVIDAIQSWLVETLVKQAVTKVVSMFTPAGAIVQAVLTLYNVVMWVIENASRLMALVEAVVNSVHAIATGAIGGAAAWIERALGNAIPIAIAFLARLIGLGGLSGKIREFITKTQAKVRAAVLGWLKKAWAWVKKLFGKLAGKPDDRTPAQKERDLNAAVAEANQLLTNKSVSLRKLKRQLPKLKKQYRLTSLEFITESKTKEKEKGYVLGEINPTKKSDTTEKAAEKTYLGAVKSGDTFEGDFSHQDWTWTGYPPVNPVVQHPANAELGYNTTTTVPKPGGLYKVGGSTAGAPEPVSWRKTLKDKKEAFKDDLLAKGMAQGDAEDEAKRMVEREYAQKGFAMTWMALNCYAEGGKGWQGHHIHPINWGGEATDPNNLQYLLQSQHHPFTTWWDQRKGEILKKLNEPE